MDVDATPVTCTLVDQLVWTLVASFVNNRKMQSRCDVISGSLCSLVHTATPSSQRDTSHTDSILPFRHALHTRVTRPQATSADYTAVHRRQPARLRPTRRRGAVAAVLPHWSHDNGRLPGGRLTLQLPPPANGHGRGALCERRNGTASAQWAPRLPGQPASHLHLQALVRAAFDHFDPDRRGLWVRHADTHAQANSYRPRAHPGRMSALAAAAAAQSCALEPEFRSRRAEVSA